MTFYRRGDSRLTLSSSGTAAIAPTFPGYSYVFSQGTDIKIVLDALAAITRVEVISSPQLLVLNNQVATLQVGDQVPIVTQQAVSTITTGAPLVNSVQYQSTGVILRVTPRVNQGGMVMMDISQEVSDVAATTTSSIDSPTIKQRKIESTVAVRDNETVALGGLIMEGSTRGRSGIPLLQDIPILGNLFSSQSRDTTKTELMVLITPHVIDSTQKARSVTEELQRKLPALKIPLRPRAVIRVETRPKSFLPLKRGGRAAKRLGWGSFGRRNWHDPSPDRQSLPPSPGLRRTSRSCQSDPPFSREGKVACNTRERERGLALVSVLWGLSILSLIAASMMSTGTLSAAMERNALRRAEADAIADSAIAIGILGLLDPRPDRRWRVDGVAQDATFAGVPLKIAIQDEFGLIDLNQADVNMFRDLFRSAGVREDEAQLLAARVIDWRTTGSAQMLKESTPEDYRAAGLPHAPRRGPFQSVNELKLVRGVTAELFARIEPALTVYSLQPNADRRTAPREALLAITGDARQVNQILADRLSAPRGLTGDGVPLGTGVIDPNLALNGHVFTIIAMFPHRETMMEKKMVVRLSGSSAPPYMSLGF